MNIKEKRAAILKQLRGTRKQSEIAEMLNISNQAYQKYEYGTAEPTFDNLSRLADFYGVSTDYLLGRSDVEPMLTVNEMEKRLVKSYFSVPPKLRAEFLQLMMQEYMKQEGITQTVNTMDIAARSPDDNPENLNKDVLQQLEEDTSEEI